MSQWRITAEHAPSYPLPNGAHVQRHAPGGGGVKREIIKKHIHTHAHPNSPIRCTEDKKCLMRHMAESGKVAPGPHPTTPQSRQRISSSPDAASDGDRTQQRQQNPSTAAAEAEADAAANDDGSARISPHAAADGADDVGIVSPFPFSSALRRRRRLERSKRSCPTASWYDPLASLTTSSHSSALATMEEASSSSVSSRRIFPLLPPLLCFLFRPFWTFRAFRPCPCPCPCPCPPLDDD